MDQTDKQIKSIPATGWLKRLLAALCIALLLIACLTAWTDPFFHYHAPRPGFFYELSNERAQNNGIVRHFSYDALITGTSFTQNFRTSEMDALFHCKSVKTSFSGATQKEMADLMETAMLSRDVRYIVASASDVTNSFIHDKDYLQDSFEYPTYLYNNNPFDDVSYLLNRDVLVQYVLPMIGRKLAGREGGVTSFDAYSNWTATKTTRGITAMGDLTEFDNAVEQKPLTEEEIALVRENVGQNLVRLANENPDTTFLLFLPPYSIAAWGMFYTDGMALKYIEAERLAIELLLQCDNVRLYSFGLDRELVCDFDNYADRTHYVEEINSRILAELADEDSRYRITKKNAQAHTTGMEELYLHYDYESLADK